MCSKDHVWEAIPDAVKRGTWCPICNTSKSENICRLFFETLFNNKFSPSWPNWLRNKSGQVMQLDGYCEPLSIAFEYQGIQHFSPDEYFSQKSSYSFKKRQEDDKRKKDICQNYGIKLFQIPYLIFKKTTIEEKVSSLRKFIKREARSLGGETRVRLAIMQNRRWKIHDKEKGKGLLLSDAENITKWRVWCPQNSRIPKFVADKRR